MAWWRERARCVVQGFYGSWEGGGGEVVGVGGEGGEEGG